MTAMLKQCKVFEVGSITPEIMAKLGTKETMAKYFLAAVQLMERQHNLAINQRVRISSYQEDIIKLQSDVIHAQEKSLKAAERISETVAESVQSGIKSYSEATGSSSVLSSSTVISPGTLKSVAKQVVIEEELSRNIMVFGLSEEENEDICGRVGKVFEELDEKPRLEARRLGKEAKSTPRPVKVTLSSATTVQQILGKSRKLRDSQFNSVYLGPDRTAEQQAEHRQLVLQLKKKGQDEPGRRHYIKGGLIFSTDLKPE
jgi:hypothetical protein